MKPQIIMACSNPTPNPLQEALSKADFKVIRVNSAKAIFENINHVIPKLLIIDGEFSDMQINEFVERLPPGLPTIIWTDIWESCPKGREISEPFIRHKVRWIWREHTTALADLLQTIEEMTGIGTDPKVPAQPEDRVILIPPEDRVILIPPHNERDNRPALYMALRRKDILTFIRREVESASDWFDEEEAGLVIVASSEPRPVTFSTPCAVVCCSDKKITSKSIQTWKRWCDTTGAPFEYIHMPEDPAVIAGVVKRVLGRWRGKIMVAQSQSHSIGTEDLNAQNTQPLSERRLELLALALHDHLFGAADRLLAGLSKKGGPLYDVEQTNEFNLKLRFLMRVVFLFQAQKLFWENIVQNKTASRILERFIYREFQKETSIDPIPMIKEYVSYIELNEPNGELMYPGNQICKMLNREDAILEFGINAYFSEYLISFIPTLKQVWELSDKALEELAQRRSQEDAPPPPRPKSWFTLLLQRIGLIPYRPASYKEIINDMKSCKNPSRIMTTLNAAAQFNGEIFPEDQEALVMMAHMLSKIGEFQSAETLCSNIVRSNPRYLLALKVQFEVQISLWAHWSQQKDSVRLNDVHSRWVSTCRLLIEADLKSYATTMKKWEQENNAPAKEWKSQLTTKYLAAAEVLGGGLVDGFEDAEGAAKLRDVAKKIESL